MSEFQLTFVNFLQNVADAFVSPGFVPPCVTKHPLRAISTSRLTNEYSQYQSNSKKTGLRSIIASQTSHASSDVGKVLGTSSAGFDSKMITTPIVRRYVSEEGENWRMWYNGRDTEFDPSVVNLATGRIG